MASLNLIKVGLKGEWGKSQLPLDQWTGMEINLNWFTNRSRPEALLEKNQTGWFGYNRNQWQGGDNNWWHSAHYNKEPACKPAKDDDFSSFGVPETQHNAKRLGGGVEETSRPDSSMSDDLHIKFILVIREKETVGPSQHQCVCNFLFDVKIKFVWVFFILD